MATTTGRGRCSRAITCPSPPPLPEPAYVAHSSSLFRELGLSDALADASFQLVFR